MKNVNVEQELAAVQSALQQFSAQADAVEKEGERVAEQYRARVNELREEVSRLQGEHRFLARLNERPDEAAAATDEEKGPAEVIPFPGE